MRGGAAARARRRSRRVYLFPDRTPPAALRRRRARHGAAQSSSEYKKPFAIFQRSVWESVKQQHPDARSFELKKIVAQQWQSLSDAEKVRFIQERGTGPDRSINEIGRVHA
jgi:hypothetical protein